MEPPSGQLHRYIEQYRTIYTAPSWSPSLFSHHRSHPHTLTHSPTHHVHRARTKERRSLPGPRRLDAEARPAGRAARTAQPAAGGAGRRGGGRRGGDDDDARVAAV
jgi:hypothetical protein